MYFIYLFLNKFLYGLRNKKSDGPSGPVPVRDQSREHRHPGEKLANRRSPWRSGDVPQKLHRHVHYARTSTGMGSWYPLVSVSTWGGSASGGMLLQRCKHLDLHSLGLFDRLHRHHIHMKHVFCAAGCLVIGLGPCRRQLS